MPFESELPDLHIEDRPIFDLVLRAAKKYRNNTALIDGKSGRKLSFRQVSVFTHAVATALHQREMEKGDVMAIILPNCIEYALVFLGTAMRGGVSTIVNPAFTQKELEHQLKDSGAKFVLTNYKLLQSVLPVAQKLNIKRVFVIRDDKSKKLPENVTDFDEILGTFPKDQLPEMHLDHKTDLVLLPYSKGNGIMITHYNLTAMLTIGYNKSFFLFPAPGDSTLGILPFYDFYGFSLLFASLVNGVSVVTMPKFEPISFLGNIQKHNIEMLFLDQPIANFLATFSLENFDLSSLKVIQLNAKEMTQDLCEKLYKQLPNLKFLIRTYGKPEMGLATLMPPAKRNDLQHASSGILLPNFECKITDPVTGLELKEPNKTGELCFRSCTLMKGYLNKPSKTANTIDNEGFLHTGDRGYCDEDGYFFINPDIGKTAKPKL